MSMRGYSEPCREIAIAIVARAVKDAKSRNGHALEARRWLMFHPWAADLCNWLDIDRENVKDWVLSLPPLSDKQARLDEAK